MAGRTDPYRNFSFRVEIKGITEGGFNECSFGETTTEVAEYREGTDPAHTRKLSGQTKYGNITLKWGITDDNKLYEWYSKVIEKGALENRMDIAIVLTDEAGNDKSRWNLEKAWPTKYDPTDFNAKGNDIAIETLEIVTESYKKVS